MSGQFLPQLVSRQLILHQGAPEIISSERDRMEGIMFGLADSNRCAFIEATREARQERAAERERELAAIKIQCVIRGWLIRQSTKSSIQNEFNSIFSEDGNYHSSISLPLATDAYKVASRNFRFCDLESDFKKFEIYMRYLLASVDCDNIKYSCISCAVNKELAVVWIQHIKNVIWVAAKQLSYLQPEIPSHNRLISLYLRFLLNFTATSAWRAVNKPSMAPMKPALAKLTENIVADLILKGLYKIMEDLLIHGVCCGRILLSGPVLATAFTLTLRPLIVCGFSENLLSLILIHVFSIPGITYHCFSLCPEILTKFHSHCLLEKIIDFMFHEEQNLNIVFSAIEGSYALYLLANICQLAFEDRDNSLSRLAYPKFCFVVQRLLAKCGEYVTTKQSSLTQWHPILGWFAQPLDSHLNDSLIYVEQQLQLLWSREVLKVLLTPLALLINEQLGSYEEPALQQPEPPLSALKKALSSSSSSKSKSAGTKKIFTQLKSSEVTAVANICHTYSVVMRTIHSHKLKMDVVTGLCYRSNLNVHLWQLLQSLGPNCGIKSFIEILSQTNEPSLPEFHLLILFCNVSSNIISVLDDVEMYEQQKPFTLEDYSLMSSFLNNFLYKVLSNQLINIRSLGDCPLFVSVHTLLSLLYKRNTRRQYVPDTHWHIKGLKGFNFSTDIGRRKRSEEVILKYMPHVIPHEERVLLFKRYVTNERSSLGLTEVSTLPLQSTLITIHRLRLVEDGYRQLAALSSNALKGVIRVRFINEQGLDEAGIDQDGVFKEFLEETLKKVVDPSLNLFRCTSEGRLYPSSTSFLTENHLQLFEFTGKMLAKAVYSGIVIDCPFAIFFLNQVLGEQHSALHSYIDELPSLDPELYKSLTYIKHYDGNVSDLELTFSFNEDCLGELVTHELRPGGRAIPVTDENKLLYVHLMAHFKIHIQMKDQTRAFVRGFWSIINPEWLSLFSANELQRLISGDNVKVDLKDLRRNTQYYGGFHDKHRVVCWLWEILEKDFSDDERRLFLKFITSCSKPPLLGFAHLEPPFSIRCVEVGDDEDTGDTIGSVLRGFFAINKKDPINRLPTSSTCFNLLKLPNYQKKSTLREKLRYAITSNTGFELS